MSNVLAAPTLEVSPGNSHVAAVTVRTFDPSSARMVAYVGASDIECAIALGPAGATVPVAGAYRAMAADPSGLYYSTFSGAEIAALASGLGEGARLYQLVRRTGTTDLLTVRVLRVRMRRLATTDTTGAL